MASRLEEDGNERPSVEGVHGIIYIKTSRDRSSESGFVPDPATAQAAAQDERLQRDLDTVSSHAARLSPASLLPLVSCHGLLLLRPLSSSDDPDAPLYFLSDPLLDRLTPIPRPPWPSLPFHGAGLAFDPARDADRYSLVLVFQRPGGHDRIEVDVFDSIAGVWAGPRTVLSKPSAPVGFVSSYGNASPFYSREREAIHWILAYDWLLVYHMDDGACELSMLPGRHYGGKGMFLFEAGGALHFCHSTVTSIEIWARGEVGSGEHVWELKHNCELRALAVGTPLASVYYIDAMPLAVHPARGTVYIAVCGCIWSYDPRSGKTEQLCGHVQDLLGCKLFFYSGQLI